MDYAALKTELKTDPAAMGYAALLAAPGPHRPYLCDQRG